MDRARQPTNILQFDDILAQSRRIARLETPLQRDAFGHFVEFNGARIRVKLPDSMRSTVKIRP